MSLRDQLSEHEQAFNAILAVATWRDSLFFADLCWPPFDPDVTARRVAENRDPGIMFETPTRVVVIEEHGGELRYYAGGWCSPENRHSEEEERILAEGCEMGVFPSPREAVLFVEGFLAQQLDLQDIVVPRSLRHRRETGRWGE